MQLLSKKLVIYTFPFIYIQVNQRNKIFQIISQNKIVRIQFDKVRILLKKKLQFSKTD